MAWPYNNKKDPAKYGLDPNDPQVLAEVAASKAAFLAQNPGASSVADNQAKAFSTAPAPKAELTQPETFRNEKGNLSGAAMPNGNTYLGLSPSDVNKLAGQYQEQQKQPEGTAPVGTAQTQLNQATEAQALQQSLTQTEQLPVSPTGLDEGQAFKAGVVNAIPRALGLAASGAAGGFLLGGTAVGAATLGVGAPVGAAGGAIIGAVGGLVTGIASGMSSDFKKQRTDTVQGQKKTLTEGKSNLRDWATLAASDPSNRAFYVGQYKLQASKIDQAYRQMKLDTNNDLASFEEALPELAAFESFYSGGGEKDKLDEQMRMALMAPSSTEYAMLEMAYRRGATTNE